ncbi:MAG: DNA repair protein RecO [Kiritimatiellia bacterium]
MKNGSTFITEITATAELLLKTEAICLNIRPFSKTSQMVTWLSSSHGTITTSIKGAQRPKSAFIGKYDLAYTCELVFYAHESNGIHHIRECFPLLFRESLRTHWRAAIAAGYACDLALRTAQPGLPNPALYEALQNVLNALPDCRECDVPLALLWFESNLLTATGVAPDFSICKTCATTPRHLFSVEEGLFICKHRLSRLSHPLTLLLHDDISNLFNYFIANTITSVLEEARQSPRRDDLNRPEPFPGIFGLRRFLGIFLMSHLDLLPGPRRTTLDLLISGSTR